MTLPDVVRLTDARIAWFVREASRGREGVGHWAAQWGVSKRRLQQVLQAYRRTGQVPTLNPNRRPKGPALTIEEQEWIERARATTVRGATRMFKWLKDQGVGIPKHKIHAYATARKWSTPNPRKKKKRSRVRYEREHSGSLLHGDWHRTSLDHPYVIVWMDDASRFALFGGEFEMETAARSIETFEGARARAADLGLRIRDVNTDRGSPFYSNEKEGVAIGYGQFERHLMRLGIRHVVSRVNNPQTNGKLERFWLEYDRHRWRYETLTEFLEWHNDQIHEALWQDTQLNIYETPRKAFQRKLPMETLVHLQSRLAEGQTGPLTVEVIYAN